MAEPTLARLAGEAFSWICGTDLARQDLETLVAPALPEQPSDDPDDDDVSLDEDESLPWPDPVKVQAWWERCQATLARAGFAPVSWRAGRRSGRAACAARRLATPARARRRQLCLLQPGTRLFPVAAPAPRQRVGWRVRADA